MITGDDHQRSPEPLEERGGAVVLIGPSTVSEIPAHDDQFGIGAVDQRTQRGLDLWLLDGADMQVREVEEPCWHRRRRLVH